MMKKIFALSILAALANGAYAVDGTVNISGSVSNITCTVTPSSAAVTMPTVSKSALASAGQTAGTTAWSVSVSGCSGASTMTTYFELGSTTNANGRLNNNGGTATNVDVQILTSTFGVINLAAAAGAQGVSSTAVVSNAATQQFYLRYYATAAATSGTFVSNFSYTIIYT